jgi:hypothetical protein
MDFVPFQLTKKYLEKGFTLEEGNTYGYFSEDGYFYPLRYYIEHSNVIDDKSEFIPAPFYEQIFEWLRNNKNIYIDNESWGPNHYHSIIKKYDNKKVHKHIYLEYEKSFLESQFQSLCYIIDNNLI